MYAVVWLGWFGVFVVDSIKMMAFSLLYLFLCSNVVEPVVSFGVCGLFNVDDVIFERGYRVHQSGIYCWYIVKRGSSLVYRLINAFILRTCKSKCVLQAFFF